MTTITAKEARQRFSKIIAATERGEGFTITRRGKRVAVIGPATAPKPGCLPDLTEFRKSLTIRGESLCKTLLKARDKERY